MYSVLALVLLVLSDGQHIKFTLHLFRGLMTIRNTNSKKVPGVMKLEKFLHLGLSGP